MLLLIKWHRSRDISKSEIDSRLSGSAHLVWTMHLKVVGSQVALINVGTFPTDSMVVSCLLFAFLALLPCLFACLFVFETGSYCIFLADLELTV